MAKYGMKKLGMYDRLWSDSDKKYLQTFIDNSAMLQVKYKFAYKHFEIGDMTLPTGASGESIFRVALEKTRPDEMADFRSPLSSTTQMDEAGAEEYLASIPELGKGFMETASERYQKEQIVDTFGTNAIETRIISKYIEKLQSLKNTIDSRLSNMAAQLLSTGKIRGFNADNESVIWYKQEAPIPKENFVKAGALVWTSPSVDLIEQMQKIEEDFRERTGYEGAMKWNITLNMWRNVFLKNKQLKDDVTNYRTVSEKPVSLGGSMAEEWVNEYLTALNLTSPIEIIEEGEVLAGIKTLKSVRGWNDNIAVLRPVGYAGEIQHTITLDKVFAERFKSTVVEKMVASLGEGDIMTLVNYTKDNAGLPVWGTDLFCAATPSLYEFPYHVIVDTSQADS